jgi:CBS domain containing-hemolysin-like protein
VPRIWSIVHAEMAARWTSRPLHAFYVVSHPLTWVVNSFSNLILRLLGTDARADFHKGGEDLRLLIAETSRRF